MRRRLTHERSFNTARTNAPLTRLARTPRQHEGCHAFFEFKHRTSRVKERGVPVEFKHRTSRVKERGVPVVLKSVACQSCYLSDR